MSLISEALRKARQAEAAKDTKVRGVVPSTLLGQRSRSRSRLFLASTIVLAAAVGGAMATWWVLAGRPSPPVQRAAPQAAATAPTQAPSPPPRPNAEARPAVAGETAAPPATHRPTQQAAPDHPTPAAGQAPPVTAPVPTLGAPQEPAADGDRERVYVLDATLGHVKFHLDYIVYRPSAPFASINDQQVRIGTVIEGFEVEEIGPELVKLRGPHGTVVLRTH